MKNNGFTLVEILAILSILGVIAVLVMPTMLDALKNGKKMLNEYERTAIEDSGKTYVTDLDEGIKDYEYKEDEERNINGHIYKKGDKISGYDLKTYIIDSGGIDVTMETLVTGGYYDKNCVYAGYPHDGKILEKDFNCKMPKDCTLHVGINYKISKDGHYYVTDGYTSKIKSGCE